MTLAQKFLQATETLDRLCKYADAGIDIAINAGASPEENEFAVFPAFCEIKLNVNKDIAVETKVQIQEEIVEYAKNAVEAEKIKDMNKNLISIGRIMGHVAVLRELGYQVDTIHYTRGDWRVPCEIRINGKEIYHINSKDFPKAPDPQKRKRRRKQNI